MTADPLATWNPPSANERFRIIEEASSIAVVGASSNPARASNFVATYLLASTHLRFLPVNPRETEIHGHSVAPSLADLDESPDIVCVFRRAEDCPPIADEAVAVGADTLWLQLGITSDDAARTALAAGLDVVMDRCVKIEHARFAGGLHLAGFDTGVISSRRAARGR